MVEDGPGMWFWPAWPWRHIVVIVLLIAIADDVQARRAEANATVARRYTETDHGANRAMSIGRRRSGGSVTACTARAVRVKTRSSCTKASLPPIAPVAVRLSPIRCVSCCTPLPTG